MRSKAARYLVSSFYYTVSSCFSSPRLVPFQFEILFWISVPVVGCFKGLKTTCRCCGLSSTNCTTLCGCIRSTSRWNVKILRFVSQLWTDILPVDVFARQRLDRSSTWVFSDTLIKAKSIPIARNASIIVRIARICSIFPSSLWITSKISSRSEEYFRETNSNIFEIQSPIVFESYCSLILAIMNSGLPTWRQWSLRTETFILLSCLYCLVVASQPVSAVFEFDDSLFMFFGSNTLSFLFTMIAIVTRIHSKEWSPPFIERSDAHLVRFVQFSLGLLIHLLKLIIYRLLRWSV